MLTLEITKYFGLKWNPFTSEIPARELFSGEREEYFIFNVENLVFEGGFITLTGSPGTGKSVLLRQVEARLEDIAEVRVRSLSRPQSSIRDFYRELSYLFDVPLKVTNRFGGFKTLREEWSRHIKESLFRSILLIDEAQEMPLETLAELRLLSSFNLDSQNILGVVLAGDERLINKINQKDLEPLKSRVRIAHRLAALPPEELIQVVEHNLQAAGAQEGLFDKGVIKAVCRNAQGNLRACMNIFLSLLIFSKNKQKKSVDKSLFFEWQKNQQTYRV